MGRKWHVWQSTKVPDSKWTSNIAVLWHLLYIGKKDNVPKYHKYHPGMTQETWESPRLWPGLQIWMQLIHGWDRGCTPHPTRPKGWTAKVLDTIRVPQSSTFLLQWSFLLISAPAISSSAPARLCSYCKNKQILKLPAHVHTVPLKNEHSLNIRI